METLLFSTAPGWPSRPTAPASTAPPWAGGVYPGTAAPDHSIVWSDRSTLAAPIHHVLVRVDPSETGTVWASAYPGGVFKSTDNGTTWRECNFGLPTFSVEDPRHQGYYALDVAPSNHDRLYLGLYNIGVYRSDDGAATWRPINGDGQEMAGRPVTALLIDPDRPGPAHRGHGRRGL